MLLLSGQLTLLRAGHDDYVIRNEYPERCFADCNAWNAHLQTLARRSRSIQTP
jgi:hypothetical protein